MPSTSSAPMTPEQNSEQRHQLTHSIITEEVLTREASGLTHITISPRAIVTPSAKDWLRQNKIGLTREAMLATASPSKTSDRLVIVHSTNQVIDLVLEDAARLTNGGWKRKNVETVDEAAKKVVGELRRESSRVIVVLTSEPEVAACLANRNEQVRAAVVADAAAVGRMKSRLDGNVFVIDPAERSFFELRNLLRRVES